MTSGEDDFQKHVTETHEAVQEALGELTSVRAYTLSPEELRDFKAAQYALRNLSDEHEGHDVASLFDEDGEFDE